MLYLKFFIWSKSSSIDSTTNNLSIFEIIEELSSPRLPGIIPETRLIALFERNVEKDLSVFECTVIVKNNDKKIGEQPFQVDFKGLKRNRTIISVPILNIEKEGTITFSISHKNKEIGQYKIDLIKTSN